MVWPVLTDCVSHWAFLWCVRLSRATQGTTAQYVWPDFLKSYPEMKQYSHSEEFRMLFNQRIIAIKRAYKQTVVRTDISHFVTFTQEGAYM